MREQLELLKNLQEIDQNLNEVRRQSERFAGETAELTAERDRVGVMVESLAQELARLEGELREQERTLGLEQDNVAKAEGRLPAIKTQKEYVAVLKEIDTAKKVNKEIQDRIRAKRDEIDAVLSDKTEKDAEFATVAGRCDERCAAITVESDSLNARIAESLQRREELLEKLPVPVRKRYQMLIERRNGIAIVAARRGSCTGCNMHLPPQLYNSLFTSAAIQNCPHCNRLLYLGED